MSIVPRPASASASGPFVLTTNPDVEFDQRWAAWKTRGVTHERAVRRRFRVVAIVIVALAVATLVTYRLLFT